MSWGVTVMLHKALILSTDLYGSGTFAPFQKAISMIDSFEGKILMHIFRCSQAQGDEEN
jgi:hypothetical protein